MGMYTALHFNATVKKEIVPILRWMTGQEGLDMPELPDHPLFRTERWERMLSCYSAYFPGRFSSEVVALNPRMSWGRYELSVNSSFKNYHGEVGHFVDWIMPYVEDSDGAFLGYHQYEEAEHPTLIYKEAR